MYTRKYSIAEMTPYIFRNQMDDRDRDINGYTTELWTVLLSTIWRKDPSKQRWQNLINKTGL